LTYKGGLSRETIKKICLERNLSQFEVAKRTVVSQIKVPAIERGYIVSKTAFERICKVLDIDSNELLKEVDEVEN
jgi:transcriptional regulator with XRE-family HTH domain